MSVKKISEPYHGDLESRARKNREAEHNLPNSHLYCLYNFRRWLLSLLVLLISLSSLAFGQPQDGRYLYLASPDGAQEESQSGAGILIFDMDNNFEFIRRINIPTFNEGVRGLTGNLKTNTLYFSTTDHRVGAFDLEKEKIEWKETYGKGVDRSSVTMDGKKIYGPTGWWYSGTDSGLLVINADNGQLMKQITVGPAAHNSIVSLDGQRLYLGTTTMLSIFDTKTDSLIRQIEEVGESGIFPYTIDSAQHFGYICLGDHIGFDVVNLQNGQILHRVFGGEKKIPHRTHGIALTPDETELWISDQEGKKLFVFDATKMPPEPKAHLELSAGGHGWVNFSLDGQYALTHTPDVFDTKTKKRVALLKDENGNLVGSSKFIEVHFRDGKVVKVGNEFGLGRKQYK